MYLLAVSNVVAGILRVGEVLIVCCADLTQVVGGEAQQHSAYGERNQQRENRGQCAAQSRQGKQRRQRHKSDNRECAEQVVVVIEQTSSSADQQQEPCAQRSDEQLIDVPPPDRYPEV